MLAKVVKILFLFFFYKCCYSGSPDKKKLIFQEGGYIGLNTQVLQMWKWAYLQGIHLNHMILVSVIVIPPGETIYKSLWEIKQQCCKNPVGALSDSYYGRPGNIDR